MSTSSWPDVVQAITTAGAALIAAVALALSALAYRRESSRDDRTLEWDRERRAREERAEQADHVAAWLQEVQFEGKPHKPYGSDVARPTIHRRWGAQLVNGSRLPVYDVVLMFLVDEESRGRETFDVLPPGERFESWPGGRKPATTGIAPRVGVRLWFRDAGGRTWLRDVDGVLSRVGASARASIGADVEIIASGTVDGDDS